MTVVPVQAGIRRIGINLEIMDSGTPARLLHPPARKA
jgi:hypothetical protein